MPEIENAGVRFCYELSGDEQNPGLVLAHSLGSNLHMWDKIAEGLARKFRLLRFDMRGHGKSGVPPGPYTIEQLGQDVLLLLDRTGIEQADFCGLSLGGLVALWLGIHAAERIGRLVLANTAARIGSRGMWDAKNRNGPAVRYGSPRGETARAVVHARLSG